MPTLKSIEFARFLDQKIPAILIECNVNYERLGIQVNNSPLDKSMVEIRFQSIREIWDIDGTVRRILDRTLSEVLNKWGKRLSPITLKSVSEMQKDPNTGKETRWRWNMIEFFVTPHLDQDWQDRGPGKGQI